MRFATPTPCTMPDVVLDANVLVAWLDAGDALHGRERRIHERCEITVVVGVMETRLAGVLGVVRAISGVLNVKDALLVVLQSDGDVGNVRRGLRRDRRVSPSVVSHAPSTSRPPGFAPGGWRPYLDDFRTALAGMTGVA